MTDHTEAPDIVEPFDAQALRDWADSLPADRSWSRKVLNAAAAEIERLREQVKRVIQPDEVSGPDFDSQDRTNMTETVTSPHSKKPAPTKPKPCLNCDLNPGLCYEHDGATDPPVARSGDRS